EQSALLRLYRLRQQEARDAIGEGRLPHPLRAGDQPGMRQPPGGEGLEERLLRRFMADQPLGPGRPGFGRRLDDLRFGWHQAFLRAKGRRATNESRHWWSMRKDIHC